MKKLLFVAAAFGMNIGLLQAQKADPVALQISTVNQATAGESFTVRVAINKQNAQGFARFHVDLPKGFEADEVEYGNAGAEFDFRDQRVRFVWGDLPEEREFSISYRVRITEPRLKGNLSLLGRFTYVVNSERQMADVTAQVTIVPSPQVAAAQAIDIEAYQNGDGQPLGETSAVEAAGSEPAAFSAGSSTVKASDIFVVRQKPYMVDKEYYINIQITKASLSGSGRIDEELAAPVSKIEAIETKGALFSTEGTKISFVWSEIPQDTGNFVIAYKVTPWQGNAPLSVQGVFTYSNSDGNTTDVKIVEREVDFSVYVPVPPLVAASQAPEAPVVKQRDAQHAQRGLVFKVQLLATRQPVQNRDAYFNLYSITEVVTEEVYEFDPQQYTYKYVVGPFKKYEQAQSYRDQVWRKGITDAFVTCYYNGDRITIQAALMISNKKH
jgi:hypothetical protein